MSSPKKSRRRSRSRSRSRPAPFRFESPSPSLTNFVVRTSTKRIISSNNIGSSSSGSHDPATYDHLFWDTRASLGRPVPITDESLISKLNKIGMPPGYASVFYNMDPSSDIVAIGIDSMGRKQYRYAAEASRAHEVVKFARMIEFSSAIDVLRRDVDKILSATAISPRAMSTALREHQTVVALAVHLMDIGHFRIGSDTYHDSFGVSNLQPRHVRTLARRGVHVSFKGKSGVMNEFDVGPASDRISKMLLFLKSRAETLECDHLFHWFGIQTSAVAATATAAASVQLLHAHHINEFIAAYGPFSAKDFRTHAANVALLEALAPSMAHAPEETLKQRRAFLKQCVAHVASLLHHTPSNCKKSYMYAPILRLYLEQPQSLQYMYVRAHNSRHSISQLFQAILLLPPEDSDDTSAALSQLAL